MNWYGLSFWLSSGMRASFFIYRDRVTEPGRFLAKWIYGDLGAEWRALA
jgi:hypothetical protein